MDNFFDNLCRILATPMPRLRAFKLIVGALAAAVLAPFGFAAKNNCGTVNCTPAQKCCNGGGPTGPYWCCPGGYTCGPTAGACNYTQPPPSPTVP
jgi:hypothetical protein